MSSRRVLGFSAEHALSLFFTRTYGYNGPSLQRLRPVLLSEAQRCISPWSHEGRASRATHSRGIQTSSRRPQSVKVSPSPAPEAPSPNTATTTKASNAPSPPTKEIDLEDADVLIPLSHQFRNLMRLLTHSVVVCTSTHLPHPSTPSQGPTPRAMTMSSFTSLSLLPTPAISFNIATPSRTLDAIKSSRRFNIHVLSADSSGAKVANWCRQGNEGALHLFQRLREDCECEVTTDGPAMLQGPGVLHVLRCRLLDDEDHGGLVKVRDHVIVLGEVLEIVDGGGQDDADPERPFGLAYADTKYREPGRSIRTERLQVGLKERR